MEPIKFTINFDAILAWVMTIGYPLLKIASSWYITKREFQYPVWDRDGVQIERRLHHVIRAYIRNFMANPEWAVAKLVAFGPVWLISGMRFWHTFAPWRVKKAPAFCQTCNDRGKYLEKGGFLTGTEGTKGTWHTCPECERTPSIPDAFKYTCAVCLDTGSIGPNRPCPHCERRKMLNKRAQQLATAIKDEVERKKAVERKLFPKQFIPHGAFTQTQGVVDRCKLYGIDYGKEFEAMERERNS